MKRLLSLALIVVLTLGMSVFAFAHGGRNNVKRGDYQDELNLSTSQLDRIEKLKDKYHDQADDFIDELEDKSDELRDLYFAKGSSRDQIVKVQKEVKKLQDSLFELRLEMHLKLRKILTTEQLERMEDRGLMGFGCMGSGFGMMRGMFRGSGNFGHHRGPGFMHEHGMMGW